MAPCGRVLADDGALRRGDRRDAVLLRLAGDRWKRRRLAVAGLAAFELHGDEHVARDVVRAGRDSERLPRP